MEESILLKDTMETGDKLVLLSELMKGGPKKTEVQIFDENDNLVDTTHNKIVITGSVFNAINVYGIPSPVIFPNYNNEMQLDNTLDYETVTPKNNPIICLFCVGDTGCGSNPNEVFTANFVDRIPPDKVFPFRYVKPEDDLSPDMRKYYFGRKTLTEENRIAYYFKAPSTQPKLHVQYADGTQVVGESIYNVDTTQAAEVFVEMQLTVTKDDLKDYFDQVIGWDKARISSLSLLYAWYDDSLDENHYRWYQQILPMSVLNFSMRLLASLDSSLRFQYRIYF